MGIAEILLIGAALSVDAFAAGMSDAMIEPHMSAKKAALIALTFAFFQFAMPVLGYYCGAAFSSLVERIAPYLSFALLFLIGGRAVLDGAGETRGAVRPSLSRREGKRIGLLKILLQGVATSLDALAVGVTFFAEDVTRGLPVHIILCSLLIGATTFAFSSVSVRIGKAAGERFSARAQFVGGAVLVFIGFKLLLDGVL